MYVYVARSLVDTNTIGPIGPMSSGLGRGDDRCRTFEEVAMPEFIGAYRTYCAYVTCCAMVEATKG